MKTIYKDRLWEIPGRGMVLIVNLIKNKLAKELWIDKVPLEIGEKIQLTNGTIYEIKGIEMQRNLMNGKISSSIGLVVKEVKQ